MGTFEVSYSLTATPPLSHTYNVMAEKENEKQEEKSGDEDIDVTAGRGHTRIHISTGKVVLNNFLGGLSWGFGTVLGATLVVALVIFVLTKLNDVPIIGDFFSSILQTIQQPIVK